MYHRPAIWQIGRTQTAKDHIPSGSSRHCAPLRAIQSIPLSISRLSFRGRPRFPVLSGRSIIFIHSHCSFVNSYRFILLFSHIPLFCTISIFQTRPNLQHCRSSRKPFGLTLWWLEQRSFYIDHFHGSGLYHRYCCSCHLPFRQNQNRRPFQRGRLARADQKNHDAAAGCGGASNGSNPADRLYQNSGGHRFHPKRNNFYH